MEVYVVGFGFHSLDFFVKPFDVCINFDFFFCVLSLKSVVFEESDVVYSDLFDLGYLFP